MPPRHIAGEHSIESFDVLTRVFEIRVIVFPILRQLENTGGIVLFEHLRGTFRLVRGGAELLENVHPKIERASDGFAIERRDPSFDELVGVHAADRA